MNIKKFADYSSLFAKLDILMAQDLQQMERYLEIGKAVCSRPEKGAAVAAAKYLQDNCPDVMGFSSRNVRRMRDLYRRYENSPALLEAVLKIGWTQNIVILENCGSDAECLWYIKAVRRFGWSKQKLASEIADQAYTKASLKAENPHLKSVPGHFFAFEEISIYTGHNRKKRTPYLQHWHPPNDGYFWFGIIHTIKSANYQTG